MWTCNCARVYVGSYLGGGTNEFERPISCNYEIIRGNVFVRKLRLVKVTNTNSEETTSALKSLAIYPKTDVAIIRINNSKDNHLVKLTKQQQGAKRTIFNEIL